MVLKKLKNNYRYEQLLFFISNPLFLVFFWNCLALILFWIIPTDLMLSFAKENKYYTFHSIFLYTFFTLAFALGYLTLPKNFFKKSKEFKREKLFIQIAKLYKILKLTAYITFLLTLIGYFLWFKNIFFNLNYYLSILFQEGAYYTRDILKEHMISGITTFTQFGIITSILFFILSTYKKKRIYIFFILLIIFLSVLRAILFGERLAVLEVIIPLVFIYLRLKPYKIKIFAFLVFLFFIILWSSELLRSYMSPTYHDKYSPLEFLIYRLVMYFVTTINNAFVIFDKFPSLQEFFPETLHFFYKLIGYKLLSYKIYKHLLENYLNPEYNNKSAWGSLYFDFGVFGLVFSIIIGMISKYFYIQYKKNNLWGILVYPIFIVFLLQSYRILYINSSRIIYPFITIILLYIIYISINSKKMFYNKGRKE